MPKTRTLKPKRKKTVLQVLTPYLFLLPLFVLLGVFKMYSSAYAIFKSFFNWDGGRVNEFVGFANYIALFQDATFLQSMWNLLVLLVTSILKVVTLPLIAAELVVRIRSRKISNFVKYALVIPMVVPGMVIILLWQWIYDYNGLINTVLGMIGLGDLAAAWLGQPSTALLSIILYNFPWVAGIQFLIFLSGLQSIDQSIYEAAAIEGIGPVKRMFKIDIPLLAGQFRYLIITTAVSTFQAFEYVQILTNGGPGTTTMVPALYLYNQSFSYYRLGYACAMGTVLFLLTLVFTGANMKLIRKNDTY